MASASFGQEIKLSDDEENSLPKFGIVALSGEGNVDLEIGDIFFGDRVRGRVLLLNDTDQAASIANVSTSCGCTTAVPLEKHVPAKDRNLLLVDYEPKATGKNRVEVKIRFGEKDFLLSGVVLTKPRLVQDAASIEFDRDGRASISLRKTVATPIEKLQVLPASMKIQKFVDARDRVTATLIRDMDATHSEARIIPVSEGYAFQDIRYSLKYEGIITVLPRRVFPREGQFQLFLMGDVGKLAGVQSLKVDWANTLHDVSCEAKLTGDVLRLQFQFPLPKGEHLLKLHLHTFSFSIPVTLR